MEYSSAGEQYACVCVLKHPVAKIFTISAIVIVKDDVIHQRTSPDFSCDAPKVKSSKH